MSFKPVADILIEVVSEQNGKVYRAISKPDGTYKIKNIPPGNYKLTIIYRSNGQIIETQNLKTDDSICMRKRYFLVEPK